jgi:predicted glycosyltransferase
VKVWLDIDNPPKARYLLPLAARFERAGCEVLLTAVASDDTQAILDSEGATYHAIGASSGKGIFHKLHALAARRKRLLDFLRDRRASVDLLVSGSRSATMSAPRLGIPSFAIVDYEHVNLSIFRLAGSYILHPEIIGKPAFMARGIPENRLMPFRGLKEDFTFADIDVASVTPWSFPGQSEALPCVLIRPPAEESHYYRSESLELLNAVLRHLAQEIVQVVYSPRYDWQVQYLHDIAHWRREPIVLLRPVPFVALLKSVDAVVSAGGTMLREAAYLGIPAYSIFRSRTGAVDEYLASIGRLSLLTSPYDLSSLRLQQKKPIDPLRDDSKVIDEVVSAVLSGMRINGFEHRRTPFLRWRKHVV